MAKARLGQQTQLVHLQTFAQCRSTSATYADVDQKWLNLFQRKLFLRSSIFICGGHDNQQINSDAGSLEN